MPITALTRARVCTMTSMRARSLRPAMVLMSIDARSVRAFFGTEHRRLPAFHDILRSPARTGRIHRHDLAGDQPIEEHADRGQVPLDRRGHARMLLNAGGDHNRCNRSEVSNPSLLRPG